MPAVRATRRRQAPKGSGGMRCPGGRAGRAAGASLSRWAAGKAGKRWEAKLGTSTNRSGGTAAAPSGLAPPEGGLEQACVRQFGRRRDWWYTNNITLVKGGKYFVGMVAGEVEGGRNSRETAEDLGPDPNSAWGQRRKLSHTWGRKRGAVGQPAGRPGCRDRFGLGVPGEAAEATAAGH